MTIFKAITEGIRTYLVRYDESGKMIRVAEFMGPITKEEAERIAARLTETSEKPKIK
jgi:hypothetical protein